MARSSTSVSPGSSTPSASSYDEVPYPSHAIADTHPDRLATIGALFGVDAPDPARCRVLDLGCARGDNVMAMATTLPGASFLGVDGSARQIADGERRRAAAGLDNVRLLAADFTRLPGDLGEFDYIVCHGVYSWVSPETADLILRLCRRHLAPHGIAYVSYNTYPGWYKMGMLREMMKFHVRGLTQPRERVEQSRALVRFLARFAKGEAGTYRAVFESLAKHLDAAEDFYIFHEYLEEHNRPVYFTEFAERASEAGLQYVGPADFTAWDNNLPEEVAGALGNLQNRVVREQYLDYLCNRTFRRSLLSRAEFPVRESPDADVVRVLFAAARAGPVRPEPDVASETPEEFVTQGDDRITTNRPLAKAALTELARRAPGFLSFQQLWQEARSLAGEAEEQASENDLAEFLLQAFQSNLVRLVRRPPSFADRPAERPRAAALARIQAAEDVWVTTLLHRVVQLNDLDRFVLRHCDGECDREEIVRRLASALKREEFSLKDPEGAPVREPDRLEAFAAEETAASLARLAGHALLMA